MSNLVETFYYQIYNSVLLGDLTNAKMYLTFLRSEYETNEEKFEALKSDYRWEHLVKLGNAIDNNQVLTKDFKVEKDNVVVRYEDETIYKKQDDLVKAIILSQNDLRMCLGAESDFYCTCTELETKFGRVDLVAQDKQTVYPIEVKKNGAFHDCIGQINKYVIHFELGLINKIYRFVQGVVIANSFDEYIIHELCKIDVVAVKYKFKSNQQVEFTLV